METPQIFLWLLDAAAQLKLWRSPAASSVFSLGLPEYLFKRTVRSPLDHKLVTPVTRLRYALSDILPLCWISHVYGNDSNRKVHFSSCFTPSLADVFYIIHFSQLHLHVCCTICGLGPALGLHWLLPPPIFSAMDSMSLMHDHPASGILFSVKNEATNICVRFTSLRPALPRAADF